MKIVNKPCLLWGPDLCGNYFAWDWKGDLINVYAKHEDPLNNILRSLKHEGYTIVSPNSFLAACIRDQLRIKGIKYGLNF